MGGRRLGAEVIPALSRRELADPASRAQALVQQLASSGTMTAGIRRRRCVAGMVDAVLEADGRGQIAWASSVNAAATRSWAADVDGEFVVSAAEVLHEGVPGDDHLRGPVGS